MDQDIEIINSNTRIEKIKNFFIEYKKHLISVLIIIILVLFGFFFYEDYKSSKKEKLANQYNDLITNFNLEKKDDARDGLKNIINSKDKTYSPLAFYFLLDNDLINSNEEINKYFDILINDLKLEKEIKNLVIFKKGLFNSEFVEENKLLSILNPVIKSESIWKAHALYLMGEYYFSKNEMQKSKEFFDQIVSLQNVSLKIKSEAQKRLRTDFSE